jgi:flagellar basal-body rod modification protein FlgD
MITNVAAATTGSGAAQAAMKQSTGMNKDDFLKLFVTQLQNQDPLNPQDGTEFIGQLAQLTQVEQAYNTNSNLQNMLNQASNSATLAAVSLIGKEVEAPGSQLTLQSGPPAAIDFKLSQAAQQVTVTIKDENGATVKTLDAGAKGAGAGSIAWDGSNDAGTRLAAGVYSFSVSAKTASGANVESTGLVRGKVDGVDMSGSTPLLSIGRIKLNLTDVTSVSQGG